MRKKIIGGFSVALMIAVAIIGSCKNKNSLLLYINEVSPSNGSNFRDEDGEYVDWIEIYNAGENEICLKGFGLSDKKDNPKIWEFPDVKIQPKSYLLICASGKNRKNGELHTNFKINAEGERLYLCDTRGQVISSVEVKNVSFDRTFGRIGEMDEYAELTVPTPGLENVSETMPETHEIGEIFFSLPAGYYDEPITLELATKEKNAQIYYTLDGSIPNLTSMLYEDEELLLSNRTGELNRYTNIWCTPVDFWNGDGMFYGKEQQYKANVVKTRLYFPETNCWSKDIWCSTYLIGAKYSLPIISLSLSEELLFEEQTGIYVPGIEFDQYMCETAELPSDARLWRGNYSSDTKVLGYLEYFDNGCKKFENQVTLRICGAASRGNAQKSFAVYAWGNEKDKMFSSFRLRAFGNDWRRSMFRDALSQELVSDLSLGVQGYQPCILLINGEYFGVYEMRENRDDEFFERHFGIHQGNLVKTELFNLTRENADLYGNEFLDLIEFAETKDLSIEENYEELSSRLDIMQFIDYMIVEQYLYNVDWPENNVLVFKSIQKRKESAYEDGKWRFVLYDMDYAINYPGENNFDKIKNSESHISVLLNALLDNENFVKLYKNRFEELLETCFEPSRAIETVIQFQDEFSPEIEETLQRWNVYSADGTIVKEVSVEYWYEKMEDLKQFFMKRPEYAREYFYNSIE